MNALNRRLTAAVPHVRRIATGGTMVVIATVLLSNVIRVGSSMILTRLLDARAFGIVGVVSSIAFVMVLLADLSFAPFIIRNERGADPRFLDQVWTIRLVRGVITALAAMALAEPVAAYAHRPELAGVFEVYSLTFILDGLSSLTFATAVREFQLKRLSTLDLSSSVLQTLAGILFAFLTRSYWALIWSMVAGSAIRCVLSYALFPGSRRRFEISRERMRELWRFSRLLLLSSFLTLLIAQTDKLVLVPTIPIATFGLYSIAMTIAIAPQALATSYVSRILLPSYADAWRSKRADLSAYYYARKRWVMAAYVFAAGGLLGSASLVVAILYDPRYAGVAQFIHLLTITTILVFNNSAATEMLIAAGRSETPLISNLIKIAWIGTLGTAVVVTGHPVWIIAVVSTFEVPCLLYYWIALRRIGVLDLRHEVQALMVAAAGVATGAVGARIILSLYSF